MKFLAVNYRPIYHLFTIVYNFFICQYFDLSRYLIKYPLVGLIFLVFCYFETNFFLKEAGVDKAMSNYLKNNK